VEEEEGREGGEEAWDEGMRGIGNVLLRDYRSSQDNQKFISFPRVADTHTA
jgi:hypothetical protein